LISIPAIAQKKIVRWMDIFSRPHLVVGVPDASITLSTSLLQPFVLEII